MSFEERVLLFRDAGITVRLSYGEHGEVDLLRFELDSGQQIVVRSRSVVEAPEKIYELLRECELN